MSRVGFIISLDNLTDNGDRTNWCSTKQFWTNQSIQLSGTSVDNTTARVGDSVTIQVEVRGLFWTNNEGQTFTQENNVNVIQAWACYPNTIPMAPGAFNVNAIVPSMNPSNPNRSIPPTLPNPPAICFGGSTDDPAPVTTGFLNLAPVWKPTADDLLPPNQDGHVCIVANCAGIADVNGDQAPIGFTIPNDDLTQIDIAIIPSRVSATSQFCRPPSIRGASSSSDSFPASLTLSGGDKWCLTSFLLSSAAPSTPPC